LQKDINMSSNDLVEKKKQIEPLREALESLDVQYFSFLHIEQLHPLALKLVEVRKERERALRKYLADSPKIRSIDINVDLAYKALRDEVEKIYVQKMGEIAALQAKIDKFVAQKDRINERNLELQGFLFEYEQIKRDAELMQVSYEAFFKQREEAEVDRAVNRANLSSHVTILKHGKNTAEVIFPKKLTTMILGLIIGFVTGLSLAFTMAFFDHAFKSPSDVTRYVQLPVIFSLKNI